MFMTILNLLLSFFTLAMTAVMLFSFRKPRRVTVFSSLISALISLILPVLFLTISGAKPDLRLALPFFSFGLLLGFLRGVTMKLEFVGDQVVGRHSILFLLLWGFSLALNQALSTLNSNILMAVGLISIFISTGTQVGFYGILAARRLALVPPEADSGKLTNQTAQRIISLAFGGLLLVFLIESMLFSIPALPFLTSAGASPQQPGDEMDYSATGLEEENQTDEIPSAPEPYFNGEQVLVWTRPLDAFLMESEHILYAFNADGSGVSKVYDEPTSADDSPAPQLSPDGNLWIVTSKRTGDYQQYLMTADGSRTYQLRYQDTPVTIMDWSPDGSQILVQAQLSGNWNVLVTDREGTDWHILANQPADEIEPRWSPDGDIILYQSDQDGNQEIYRVGLNGGEPVNLTHNSSEDKRASWALNGTRIIFTSDRDGFFGLYHMDPDGSDIQLIGQDSNCGLMYQLSPDEDHILFATDPYYEGDNWDDKREECQSANQTLTSLTGGVTNTVEINSAGNTKWSPDGSKIMYAGPYNEANDHQDIFVIHVDGTGLVNISPPDHRLYQFIWSPDSKYVAQIDNKVFEDGSFLRYGLSITDADGTNRRDLSPIPWGDDIATAYSGFSWP